MSVASACTTFSLNVHRLQKVFGHKRLDQGTWLHSKCGHLRNSLLQRLLSYAKALV